MISRSDFPSAICPATCSFVVATVTPTRLTQCSVAGASWEANRRPGDHALGSAVLAIRIPDQVHLARSCTTPPPCSRRSIDASSRRAFSWLPSGWAVSFRDS